MRTTSSVALFVTLGAAIIGSGAFVNGARASAPSTNPAVSAGTALNRLVNGNKRFLSGKPARPNQTKARIQQTSKGQAPFATILTCSDSRVSPEIVFDQGIGDLFIIRVAGNVAATSEMGTIEYGTKYLGSQLLVVMGHTKCGAVDAVCTNANVTDNIQNLVKPIVPAVHRAEAKTNKTGKDLVPFAIKENVFQSIEDLLVNSPTLRELVAAKKLDIMAAIYDISTGRVEFLGRHPEMNKLVSAVNVSK